MSATVIGSGAARPSLEVVLARVRELVQRDEEPEALASDQGLRRASGVLDLRAGPGPEEPLFERDLSWPTVAARLLDGPLFGVAREFLATFEDAAVAKLFFEDTSVAVDCRTLIPPIRRLTLAAPAPSVDAARAPCGQLLRGSTARSEVARRIVAMICRTEIPKQRTTQTDFSPTNLRSPVACRAEEVNVPEACPDQRGCSTWRMIGCRCIIRPSYSETDMTPLDTTPEAHRIQVDIFRRMGPLGRFRKALELTETSRRLLARGVRCRHPDYSEEEIHLAVIRLQLPEDLFVKAYPQAASLRP